MIESFILDLRTKYTFQLFCQIASEHGYMLSVIPTYQFPGIALFVDNDRILKKMSILRRHFKLCMDNGQTWIHRVGLGNTDG